MKAKSVTYKECKEARQRATKLISDVRNHDKIKGKYKFFQRLIGSGKRRCIVKDYKGKYDLDYQIVLTKNSKSGDKNPTQIKTDFLQAFKDSKRNNEKVENSTTVVTVRSSKSQADFNCNEEKFSFDFVIINSDENKRIRRNGDNQYTWVELPTKKSFIYEKFNSFSEQEKKELFEKKVIPKIVEEKNKNESMRKPSIDIFYEEVNNWRKHD